MNEWTYHNKLFTSEDIGDNYGFVYLITNTINNRKYIGKKFFWAPKYRMIKKKRKKYLAESDWKDYYGSSIHLKKDIEIHGKGSMEREILHLCINKGTCSYLEMKEQIINDVLLDESYYNGFIGGKIHAKHVKIDK